MLELQGVNKDNLPLKANKEYFLPTSEPQNKRLVPQLNQMLSTTKRGMWTNEALEATMDVIERRTYSLRKASNSWNILMNSLFYHLNGKTKSMKMELGGVCIRKECGLSISLQQLKMKVIKLIQARVTPLWDGMPCNSQWYWFKHKHLEVNI
jgi:hypothetical protein